MNIVKLENTIDYNQFKYPKEFIRILELNLIDFDVWYILNEKDVIDKLKGLRKRYSKRKLIPFAKRDDNDDIACFEILGEKVKIQLIHDFASEGFEQRHTYDDFWEWFREVIEELIEYNKVEE